MQITGFTVAECAKKVESKIGQKVALVLNEGGMPVGTDDYYRILRSEDGSEFKVLYCVTEGDWWVRL